MALVVADRVQETTSTTSTSDYVLLGAAAGYQSFGAVLANADTTYYAITNDTDWEVGIGTYSTTGPTLARTTILASSSGGSAVSWGVGVKNIFISYAASKSVYLDASGNLSVADKIIHTGDTDTAIRFPAADTVSIETGGTERFKVENSTITTTVPVVLPADPTTSLQAATKSYVDTIASASIHYHAPVRVESPTPLTVTYNNGTAGVGATLTNAGAQAALALDGVTLSVNDRVLIYTQVDQTQNGVYDVTSVGSGSTNWVLTRSDDTDTYGASSPTALGAGDAFFVSQGATGAGELYVCNTTGTITFGTTNITFVQVAATAVYTAGTGISLTNNVITNTAPDQTVALTQGGATTITGTYPNFTISSTDTTYTAGGGIGLAGTTFSVAAGTGLTQDADGLSHADTSSQASVDNTGATFVQDINLDGFGHVTGAASVTVTPSLIGAPSTSGVGATGTWGISISGNAANVTGTVAVANGGTGATTAPQALTNLGAAPLAGPAFTGQVSLDDGSAAAPSLTNTGDTNTGLFFPAADTVGLGTGGTERMRIDASGNVGIGVTPSAWGSTFKALQFGTNAAVVANNAFWTGANFYVDSGGGFVYVINDFATGHQQYDGQHRWFNAPSGTAGNAITFTQAMTLDASGNLGIGTTSPTPLGTGITTLELKGNSASQTDRAGGISFMRYDDNPGMYIYHADDASYISSLSTYPLLLQTNGTERARIDASGDLSLASGTGVTTTADNDGTFSSGTYTPTPAGGNMKIITNSGAFTFAAPSATGDYTLVVLVMNSATAGAVTLSGFNRTVGDAFTTTNGQEFLVNITKINGHILANVVAMQ
jgi:hypothetical protein